MLHQDHFTDELDSFVPRFDINGSQIDVIDTPWNFYARLISMIQRAQTRVYLSSMYISKDAFGLRDALRRALQDNANLKLSILMDALRGTRSDHLQHQDGTEFFSGLSQETRNQTPASMLVPLIEEFGSEKVEVRLYHTPNLGAIWKRILPQRFNEGFGLQHTKIYGVDDDVIISGANLSHEYFTNRQDRYYVFSSKEISDFCEQIHRALGGFSYLLVPDPSAEKGHSLQWPKTNHCPHPLEDSKDIHQKTRQVFGPLIRRGAFEKRPPSFEDNRVDTVVYPLVQFTPLLGPGMSTHQHVLASMLSALRSKFLAGARWTLSTPYFNPIPSIRSALVSTTAKQGSMITGAPQATSFYGTAGLTGYIPAAFTPEARRFLKEVEGNHREHQVQLLEWQRGRGDKAGGWTYHAKGLWVARSGETDPFVTLIGSCNYGERSFALDLEQDALIVTKNSELRKKLGDEERRIVKHARRITREELSTGDRRTGLIVFILVWLIQLFGASI